MNSIPAEHRRRLEEIVAAQPYPLVFATISGAHLYGFPSPDSDFDLRGIHVLPAHEVLGLDTGRETIESEQIIDGLEIDLVTHDSLKFFRLLLRKNGYVLEQLMSPLIIKTSRVHEELRALSPQCITRHHCHHYLGFAETQWKLFEKELPRRLKPLLYVYRVLLTGIHLMQTGRIEANLLNLNDEFKLAFLGDLIERKLLGHEQQSITDADMEMHQQRYRELVERLELAGRESQLPNEPCARPLLNEILIRLRTTKWD